MPPASDPKLDPKLGTKIGNVTLQHKLGAGAMGVVYKGWHEALARPVAVKFLTSVHGNARARFLREGRASAAVIHPNVVRILDAGEAGTRLYLVLEFVDGDSLGGLLDKRLTQDRTTPPTERPVGALDVDAVITYGTQIANGLAAIHGQGIVHRDLKPDNILISKEGIAKITDLGLAKQVDDPDSLRLTGSGMVVGTPLYVSPEAIREAKSVTAASDIYCLGATLYHALAGKPPFNGQTAYDVMKAHLEDRQQPLAELNPLLPRTLGPLIDRCLDKNPLKRPTAEALATALSTGVWTPAQATRPTLLIAGAAAGLAALTLTGVWFLLAPGSKPVVAAQAPLRLIVDHPKVEARFDDGPWQAVGNEPVQAPLGDHRLEVRAKQTGPTLQWRGPAHIVPGNDALLTVTLARIPVTELRHTLDGSGMAYVNGEAWGTSEKITLNAAGTYHLGRWDGVVWRSQQVTVDEAGRLTADTPITAAQPEGPAWWRSVDQKGKPTPEHHLVSWWEAERIRDRKRLPTPPGWLVQKATPERPVLGLVPPDLLPFLDGFAAQGGVLPAIETAQKLAAAHAATLWTAGKSGPELAGGTSRVNALLVLVPAAPATITKP